MKLLIVSWSVLPSNGGSSVIVENLAKNFPSDELVVLGSRKIFGHKKVNRPARMPKFIYFPSELYLFGRGYRYFIWFRKMRYQPLVRKIKEIIKTENIDYVLGVYPNPFYVLAACEAAKELGVPFSSYFHNTYIENAAITDPNAKAIQDKIFKNSEHIFVMSKGMQSFYDEKYGLKKFKPLVHTFNQYPATPSKKGIPGVNKKHYKLVAIGNFNESNLDATIRFCAAIKDNPKYSLSLFTHVPKVLLRRRGLNTNDIDYEGFVNPDEVHAVLQAYDICILTHGFEGGYGTVEYKTIFPTRTIPLLLSGKPILAHSPRQSFLNDFIKENKCAELVETASKEAIIAGLERICSSDTYQRELVAASAQTAKQFYGPEVVQGLKVVLNEDQKIMNETVV